MVEPARGPFLFDTSAESWLARSGQPAIHAWMNLYQSRHPIHLSAVTVLERIRGYSLLWHTAQTDQRIQIEVSRTNYLNALGQVWPLDWAVAVVAAEIMAILPDPPTPVKRSHKFAESKPDRLSRWRFDAMIAATALVAQMPLIHNNAADFETIRGAIEVSPERFPGLGPLDLIRCSSLLPPARN